MARCLMPILVIALLALAVFFGVGILLVLAMLIETRRKALPDRVPNPEKSVSERKPAA
jgi:hypothetical protein